MNSKIIPTGKEQVVFSGLNFAIVQYEVNEEGVLKTFETARRYPGTRLIIVDKQKKLILLSSEARHELEEIDLRLPGGKVIGKIKEYLAFIQAGGDIAKKAEETAITEAREEVGIEAKSIKNIWVSHSGGSTVEWDLYYYVIDDFIDHHDQKLGPGENIEVKWFSYAEAIKLCLAGKLHEDRSVGVLLRFLLAQ